MHEANSQITKSKRVAKVILQQRVKGARNNLLVAEHLGAPTYRCMKPTVNSHTDA